MAAFKDKKNGSWYVQFRYTDWRGERQQKLKRGFATKKEAQASYHDMTFPTERLISLAAKTTCKDRWRQVINEADRLRDRPKYLCTLQQGISPAQMDEMQSENVILVVPRQYITSYPADRQDRIWTLSKFVSYVREVEGL